jgi:glycosyltransferase involved in cell wall biosynthesis
MCNPEISVIMTVYNSPEYLKDSIESILNQTLGDFEFIIIDDASTDISKDIIEEYKQKDSRITVYRNEKNIGMTKSLNIGLQHANGRYIARQDSHNISFSGRFKTQYDFLEKNRSIFLVGSGMITVLPNGKIAKWDAPDNSKLEAVFKRRNAIPHPSIMFHNERGIFYRNKFIYSQDYDFFLMLLSSGRKMACLPDMQIKYWLTPRSISYAKRLQQMLFVEKAREFYFQRVRDGKDEYDDFSTDNIMDTDIDGTADRKLIGWAIEVYFTISEYNKVKRFYRKYLKNGGKINKYALYYLVSFLPQVFIDFLRKIIWRFYRPK